MHRRLQFAPIALAASILALLTACADGSGRSADVAGGTDTRDDTSTPPIGLVVYDLLPSNGPAAGGTQVTITGDGFTAGLTVAFGGTLGLVTTVTTPDTVVVVTPPAPSGGPGAVDVALANPGDLEPYVLPSAFRYDADTAGISWCRLVFPPELTAGVGLPSAALLGRVRVDGLTDAEGPADGVLGQVGFGPAGSAPTSDAWTWTPTTYHGDADSWYPGDRAADEVAGRLVFPATGAYDYTVRFSTDGEAWTPCDLDGGAFEPSRVGHAQVVVSLDPGIAWARFVGPAAIFVARDAPAPTAVGRVLATGPSGEAPPLIAQFGLGPRGTFPSEPAWVWITGASRGDADPAPGEPDDAVDYGATPPTSQEGVWSTAWRFSADDGATWHHGDLDGSANEPDLEQLGLLRVGRTIESCRFDTFAEVTVALGDTSPVLAGVVTAVGLTDAPGPGPGLVGQLGWGPTGSDPSLDEGWQWSNAGYQADSLDLADDVFTAALQPTSEGDRALAYRFSADSGDHWLYCDRTGSTDGFSPADLPRLHVVPAAATQVDWCRLVGPLSVQVKVGSPSPPIKGSVQVQGRTGGEGPGFGVRGALGTRLVGAGEFTWTDATYAGDGSGPGGSPLAVDVYRAVVVPPVVGTWQTAFRFSADGGATWTSCDADGSDDGFELTALGSMSVFADLTAVLQEVVLETPAPVFAVAGWRSPRLVARARVPGFTDGSAPLAALVADVGFGASGSLPVQGGWSWAAASFEPAADVPSGFHRYAGQVATPNVGTFSLAARFSLSDGAWVHGDTDGSANGFSAAKAGTLTVVPPALGTALNWCQVMSTDAGAPAVGTWSPPLRAEVFAPGLTPGPGWGAGVVAQAGLGSGGLDTFEWFDAAWVADAGTNDAYEGSVQPSSTGAFRVAFRFSTDGGVNWTACDTNGPPFAAADGLLVVVGE